MPSLLVLASLALTSPSVSFAADAVTVGALVKDLARQTGTRLDVAPLLAAEPVVAQFENRPLDEVLVRLATLVDADWRDDGGVRMLGRSSSRQTDLERAERRKLAELLTRMLDLRLRRFAQSGAYDQADATRFVDRYRLAEMDDDAMFAEYRRMAADNPVLRASVAVFRTVDPTLLIRMRRGQRIVFSDVPTPTQTPIAARGREALRNLRKEVEAMETAKKALTPRKRLMNFADLPSLGSARLSDGYGKTVLVVRRQGALQFSFEMEVVARDGRRILRGAGDIPTRGNPYDTQLPQKEEPLRIPDEMRAFGTLTHRVGVKMGTTRFVKLDDGREVRPRFWVPFEEDQNDDPVRLIRPKLADPIRYDPIGLVPGPLLRQIATRRKLPLLASLGDNAVLQLGRMIALDKIRTEDGLIAGLTGSTVSEEDRVPLATFQESEGWIDVRPFLPVDAHANRIDRRALANVLASIRKEGALSLATAAAYGRTPSMGSLDEMYLGRATPEVGLDEVRGLFTPALPFLVSLSPAQWQSLDQAPVPIGELSASQREMVRRWVYEELVNGYRTFVERRSPNTPDVDRYPLATEPTEMYPAGLPADFRVSLNRANEPVVLTRSAQGLAFNLTPASIGLLEAMQANPEANPDAARRTLTGYRLATEAGYRLTLHYPGGQDLAFSTVETKATAGSRFGPRTALPAAIVREIEQVRDAILRDAKG
jgi:hypothetical protein